MTRPSKDHYFMAMAKLVATRGTCPRLQVGCVLVDGLSRLVATGYNGAARGAKHCTEIGCGSDSHCLNALHSESNAIDYAGRETIGTTAYVTHQPCFDCAKRLLNAGVVRVVYETPYISKRSGAIDSVAYLRDHGIKVESITECR